MTQFNQELITKARKGEIAILNDGSVEELRGLLKEVFPNDCTTPRLTSGSKFFMTHFHNTDFWQCDTATHLRAHSVKDFFMPETKDTTILRKENEGHQPRTYKVTRSQMKEIWEACHDDVRLLSLINSWVIIWDEEIEISESRMMELRRCFNQKGPEVLKKYFPEYFFIPEGEPVLCRDNDNDDWNIQVSDGMGGAYSHNRTYGGSVGWKQIIPFTKNPPKMTEEQLTKDWQEYSGYYCKAMQDIKLKNGDEIMMCWPNAGVWNVCSDGPYKNQEIKNSDVTHVRKTHDKNW